MDPLLEPVWSGTLEREGQAQFSLTSDLLPSSLGGMDTAGIKPIPLNQWRDEHDDRPANWTLGTAELHQQKSRLGQRRAVAQRKGWL